MMRLPREPNAGERPKASDMRLLIRYLRAITPQSSSTVLVQTSPGGTTYRASSSPAVGRAGVGSSPFQVVTRIDPDGDPTSPPNQASIYWDSSLLKNLVLNNTQAITGLSSASAQNWFAFDNGNDLIWIEITLDGSGNTTAATRKSYGLGDAWAPSDLPGEYGSGHGPFEYQLTYDANANNIYTQYLARFAIFESTTSTVAPYPVVNRQLLNQNLIMEGDVYTGALYTTADGPATIGLQMPKPFGAPYITA